MNDKNYIKDILKELTQNCQYINYGDLNCLVDEIKKANRIYLSGKGRSGLAISAFANRLMHLGFKVSLIGEVTTPHTKENDLLIIGSGSGETESLVSLAKKAKKIGLKIALITMDVESSIAKIADIIIVLPGVSPKLKNERMYIKSIQPMGSAFEQISFLTYDAIVLQIMNEIGETSDEMFSRHADLE
ncbi:6-phospho-3-hexuloisomerase [Clostridium neuense]|uniref:6-phospho-3-hexuloisomerase n=1 Tax=Clostridium neuense TaxID=1728934 RepID=A0ABW8T8P2_9CLOT